MAAEKDLRIYRTKKAINEAFLSLLEKKPFQTISIQDIADRAMINRSTFYAHYVDKYDLLEKHTEKVFSLLEELPRGTYFYSQTDMTQYRMVFDGFFEHVADNAVFYRAMFRDSPEFYIRFGDKLTKEIMVRLHALKQKSYQYEIDISEDQVDEFYARYYASACSGIVTWWLENDMIYSAKHMSKVFVTLATKNTFELYGVSADKVNHKANKTFF